MIDNGFHYASLTRIGDHMRCSYRNDATNIAFYIYFNTVSGKLVLDRYRALNSGIQIQDFEDLQNPQNVFTNLEGLILRLP
jgi:hypothetical protein